MKKKAWKSAYKSKEYLYEHAVQRFNQESAVNDELRKTIAALQEAVENRRQRCSVCGFECDTNEEMDEHFASEGPGHCTHTVCSFCGATYCNDAKREEVMAHIRVCDKHPLGIENRRLKEEVETSRVWRCNWCNATIGGYEEAGEHEKACAANPSLVRIAALEARITKAVNALDDDTVGCAEFQGIIRELKAVVSKEDSHA